MNTQSISVKIANSSQFERIASLVNDAYRGLSGVRGWTHEADLLVGPRVNVAAFAQIARRLTILVAIFEGAVVGCVSVEAIDAKEWYLSMLAVDPTRQAHGVGKLLMAEAEAYLLARDVETIRISVVNHRSALIEWYERRGYARTDEVEPFPYDDSSVGTPLRDDLALIVLKKSLRTEQLR